VGGRDERPLIFYGENAGMETIMNTIGIYIRWNGDKRVFTVQEKVMMKLARECGYDSYVAYHDHEPVEDGENIFATDVARAMFRDAKNEIITAALARIIYPIGGDLFRASDFEVDFVELPPEIAYVFVSMDSRQDQKDERKVKVVR